VLIVALFFKAPNQFLQKKKKQQINFFNKKKKSKSASI